MANDVQTRLTADNSSFDLAQKKSGDAATASGRAIEKAAKQAAQAQAFAAKFAGDTVSEQSLRIIAAQKAEMSANAEYRRTLSLTKSGLLDGSQGAQVSAAALQRLTAARIASAAAARVEAEATHASVSQQMAASAAVRSFEGNPGIRSIERFITTIPGVGVALQAIFPFIGAAGLAGLAFEAGEKLYEMGSKAVHAGELTRQAFADVHDKAQVNIDDLAVTNDKLQDQIDKISGHPNNGLATALDEARKMADKLLESLQADRKELEALLKENSVGTFASLLTGVASTGGQGKELLSDQKNLTEAVRKANVEFNAALAQTNDPKAIKAATDTRNAAVRAAYQSQIQTYQTESARLRKEQADSEADAAAVEAGGNVAGNVINNSGKIANVEGRAQQLRDALAVEQLNESIANNEVKLGGLKQSHDEGSKASEAQLRAFESQLAQMKQNGAVSAKAEFDFWQQRISAFQSGSTEYLEVQRKESELAVAGARAAHEQLQKLVKEQLSGSTGTDVESVLKSISDEKRKIAESMAQQDKASDARSDAANELEAVKQRNAASLEEIAINEQAGKTITRQAAAMQLAALHTANFGAEIDRLNAKAKQIASASYLTDADKEKELGRIQVEGSNLQTSRSAQVLRDNNAIGIPDSSAMVGAKDALEAFTASANDAAKVMQELVSSTLADINKTLLSDITGTRKRGEWTSVGHTLATSVAGGALKKGESTLLGTLGLGSHSAPKGTSGDPLHVVIANLSPSGAPGSMTMSPQALGQLLGSGSSTAKSPAGGLVSSMLPFIPGFAEGGAVSAGTLAMVGEKGPELVHFGSNAHVTPNNKLGSLGGTTHHWNIDARGSTNPAETMAMVRQGIMEAAPHIIAASIKTGRDQNSRSAPSARR